MNINEIQEQIKRCENDKNLSLKEKQVRLAIFKTAIQKISRDNYTDSLKKEFMKKMADLLEIDENFPLEDSIQNNQVVLNNYLLDSDVCKYLEKQGIINYDLCDLKYYAFDYEMCFKKDQRNIEKAVELYEISKQIMSNETQKMFVIKNGLSNIIDKETISQYNEVGKQQEDGIVMFEQTDKSKEQYSNNHKVALQTLEELYVNEGNLDRITYEYSTMMVNQLFNYYQNGLQMISLDYNQKHL